MFAKYCSRYFMWTCEIGTLIPLLKQAKWKPERLWNLPKVTETPCPRWPVMVNDWQRGLQNISHFNTSEHLHSHWVSTNLKVRGSFPWSTISLFFWNFMWIHTFNCMHEGVLNMKKTYHALKYLGDSDGTESACNAGDPGLMCGLGRFPGEGNGYPHQSSCLENFTDRGAWWVIIKRVPKSRTQMSDKHFHFIHFNMKKKNQSHPEISINRNMAVQRNMGDKH